MKIYNKYVDWERKKSIKVFFILRFIIQRVFYNYNACKTKFWNLFVGSKRRKLLLKVFTNDSVIDNVTERYYDWHYGRWYPYHYRGTYWNNKIRCILPINSVQYNIVVFRQKHCFLNRLPIYRWYWMSTANYDFDFSRQFYVRLRLRTNAPSPHYERLFSFRHAINVPVMREITVLNVETEISSQFVTQSNVWKTKIQYDRIRNPVILIAVNGVPRRTFRLCLNMS